MYFETVGDRNGQALLFLHGWGGSVDSFRCVIENLPLNKYFIINLDFPGFGRSPEPLYPYVVEDFANEVNTLLAELKVGSVFVVCHSFGCRVALELNRISPFLIKKLVIVDGAGVKRKKSIKDKYNIVKYKLLKQLKNFPLFNNLKLEKYGSSDYRKLSGIMKATFVKVVNQDLTDRLKLIKIPTLIVWGEDDKDTPLYMAKTIHKKIIGSHLIVYNNSGHFSYLDNLDDFVYSLFRFINTEV